jgi:hypothetical protein
MNIAVREVVADYCLGPVFSNGGLKNWRLHLCQEEIIGVPLGIWLSIKAGLLAGLHLNPSGAYGNHSENDDTSLLTDTGSNEWRRYPLSTIEYLMVKRVPTANEIIIKRHGVEPDIYGIGDRGYTDICRSALCNTYRAKYRETGF